MAIELTYADFLRLAYNPRLANQRSKIFRDWYGSDWFDRLFAKTDMLAGDTNVRNINYGAPAQDWMNFETNVFSLLPKVPWGPRSGFRYIDLTASRASGIQETGSLKGATAATYGVVKYDVKYHNTMFAASEKALWRGTVDDNIDRWAVEREKWGQVLGRSIDEFLVRPIYARVDAFGVGSGGATAVAQATFVIETIDRMVSSSSEATNLVNAGGLSGATSADIYPYDQRLRRSGFSGAGYGNGPFDAVVDQNAFTGRSLTLSIIDNALLQTRLNGSQDDGMILLTGPDTADQLSRLVEAKQRFTDTQRVVKTLNGVQRVSNTGVEAGFDVMSYKGIPIFTSRAIWQYRTARGAGLLSPIYGLYLPDIYISVALPTLYVETVRDDWPVLDKMRRKAGYFFGAELVFKRWMTHFKITDITT